MRADPCSALWVVVGCLMLAACFEVRPHGAVLEIVEPFDERKLEGDNRVPKREPTNPIYVTLVPAVLDDSMQQAEKTKGVMAERIRNEFAADPVIKLVEPDLTQSGLMKPHVAAPPDVEISPKVSLREAYGIDQKTGKRGKVLAVIFEATITSLKPPATYTVSDLGYAVKNQEVSKRFANRVKQVILEKIAPVLPTR